MNTEVRAHVVAGVRVDALPADASRARDFGPQALSSGIFSFDSEFTQRDFKHTDIPDVNFHRKIWTFLNGF